MSLLQPGIDKQNRAEVQFYLKNVKDTEKRDERGETKKGDASSNASCYKLISKIKTGGRVARLPAFTVNTLLYFSLFFRYSNAELKGYHDIHIFHYFIL